MNKKAAIFAALGLVGVLTVGALAVSTNMRFDEDALAKDAKRELAQKHEKSPIVKRRTIRRHKTVQDSAGGAIVSLASGRSGSGSDAPSHAEDGRASGTASRSANGTASRSGGGSSSPGDSGDEGGYEDEQEDQQEGEEHEDGHEGDDEDEDEGGDD